MYVTNVRLLRMRISIATEIHNASSKPGGENDEDEGEMGSVATDANKPSQITMDSSNENSRVKRRRSHRLRSTILVTKGITRIILKLTFRTSELPRRHRGVSPTSADQQVAASHPSKTHMSG